MEEIALDSSHVFQKIQYLAKETSPPKDQFQMDHKGEVVQEVWLVPQETDSLQQIIGELAHPIVLTLQEISSVKQIIGVHQTVPVPQPETSLLRKIIGEAVHQTVPVPQPETSSLMQITREEVHQTVLILLQETKHLRKRSQDLRHHIE